MGRVNVGSPSRQICVGHCSAKCRTPSFLLTAGYQSCTASESPAWDPTTAARPQLLGKGWAPPSAAGSYLAMGASAFLWCWASLCRDTHARSKNRDCTSCGCGLSFPSWHQMGISPLSSGQGQVCCQASHQDSVFPCMWYQGTGDRTKNKPCRASSDHVFEALWAVSIAAMLMDGNLTAPAKKNGVLESLVTRHSQGSPDGSQSVLKAQLGTSGPASTPKPLCLRDVWARPNVSWSL